MTDVIWSLARGATMVENGVRFNVWAPRAAGVAVRLTGEAGETVGEHALAPHGKGVVEGTVAGVAAGADYAFVLMGADGVPGDAVADPVSRWQPRGVHGPSRVVDPRAFRWTDEGWRGVEMADLVIY